MALRREHRYVGRELQLKCSGPLHREGVFLHVTHFWRKGKVWQSVCKRCQNEQTASRRSYETRVNVEPYHKWLEEIAFRCGSYANAARTLGIPESTMWRWLGRGNERVKQISRRSARRIIATLHGLRRETIQPITGSRTGARTFKRGCKGCGVLDLDTATVGCNTCAERVYRRDYLKRNAA